MVENNAPPPSRAVLSMAILLLASTAWAQPTIISLSPEATTVGAPAFTMTIRGSGLAAGATVRFGLRSLPAVLLSPTALQVQLGAELLRVEGSVEVRVDGPGSVSSNALVFLLRPTLLFITSPELLAASTGKVYLQAITITGGSPPYSFEVTAGSLPAGVSLDAASGALAGVPSGAGNYGFTIAVTDTAWVRSLRTFTLTVARPLLIDGPALPALISGRPFQTQLTAGGGLPPYRWSIAAGTLPTGLTLDPTGLLGGFPTAPGTFPFTLHVLDAAGLSSISPLSITVRAALSILAVEKLQQAAVGSDFQQDLTGSGGLPPYQWRLSAGALPPGLSLHPLTGTLQGRVITAGTFPFTVQVSDAGGQSASFDMTLAVTARLAITTAASLPAATLGADYSVRLAAGGGVTPYRWSLAGMPAGLLFDAATALLQGRPAAPGLFRLIASVTDSGGLTADLALELTITLPRAPALTVSGITSHSFAARQVPLLVQIAEPFPAQIDGTLTLEFTPVPGAPDDPAIQFTSGGRSAPFRIAAGSIQAAFTVPVLALQTGTVAGTLRLIPRALSLGIALDPQPAIDTSQVLAQIPALDSVELARTPAGFDITVKGFSNTRELVKAMFRFQAAPGSDLRTLEIELPLEALSSGWFGGTGSSPFGGMFSYRQGFLLQGDAAAATAVTVELVNTMGGSQKMTAAIQR